MELIGNEWMFYRMLPMIISKSGMHGTTKSEVVTISERWIKKRNDQKKDDKNEDNKKEDDKKVDDKKEDDK